MLTGLANVDSVIAARESGVGAYLRKPYSAEQLEQKIRALAVLMLTGLANVDSVIAARESGVGAYLRKPYSAEQLEQKIRALAAKLAPA